MLVLELPIKEKQPSRLDLERSASDSDPMKTTSGLVVLITAACSVLGWANEQQTEKAKAAKSGDLFDAIARADVRMFEAFNAHDVEKVMATFTDDLEFYHDTGGVTDFPQTKEGFSKLFSGTPDIRRDLVSGSLEVYPIKDYGAIQVGEHRFCHKEKGKDDCGTFKFAMIWRKVGEDWKISRVISYGH